MSVAVLALIMTLLQIIFLFRKPRFIWFGWSAALSFASLLYALGVFLEYNTPAGPINHFAGLLEFTAHIFLIQCAYGWTFSRLGMKGKTYHLWAGLFHAIVLVFLWTTNHIVADEFVNRHFSGLAQPFVEHELGPLGPLFELYILLSSIGVIVLWIRHKGPAAAYKKHYLAGPILWIVLGVHDGLASMGMPTVQYLMEYGFIGFSLAVLWGVFNSYVDVAAEDKYRIITELANDGILVVQDGKTIYANPACSAIAGRSVNDSTKDDLLNDIASEDRPRLIAYYNRLKNSSGPNESQPVHIRRPDGEEKIIEHRAREILYRNRPAILTILRDVTEKIREEEALKESEERHRLMIESLPLAVFVERQGRIVYMNPAFMALFKIQAPDQVIGSRLIEFVAPELFDTIEERRRTMEDSLRAVPSLELNLRCMDGSFITVVSTAIPIIFQGQSSVLSALYDITERKNGEVELQKAHKLLQIQIKEIENLQAKLKEQAIHDPLTGLFNRRYLEESLDREMARANREGFSIGMVMIDIDHFKKINDTYGHRAGDLILKILGNHLLGGIRAGDIACRYGGEEFLLILPQASKATTTQRAEQWRIGFESLETVFNDQIIRATISLGVAVYPADGINSEAVINAADQAMYRAKALGRNRVVSL